VLKMVIKTMTTSRMVRRTLSIIDAAHKKPAARQTFASCALRVRWISAPHHARTWRESLTAPTASTVPAGGQGDVYSARVSAGNLSDSVQKRPTVSCLNPAAPNAVWTPAGDLRHAHGVR
jgi:hypothetical protein